MPEVFAQELGKELLLKEAVEKVEKAFDLVLIDSPPSLDLLAINTYAAATEHVDQGLSLTLFFPAEATTRDINRAQIHAWKKGIKTIYYIRLRQTALEGTEVQGCVSCTL